MTLKSRILILLAFLLGIILIVQFIVINSIYDTVLDEFRDVTQTINAVSEDFMLMAPGKVKTDSTAEKKIEILIQNMRKSGDPVMIIPDRDDVDSLIEIEENEQLLHTGSQKVMVYKKVIRLDSTRLFDTTIVYPDSATRLIKDRLKSLQHNKSEFIRHESNDSEILIRSFVWNDYDSNKINIVTAPDVGHPSKAILQFAYNPVSLDSALGRMKFKILLVTGFIFLIMMGGTYLVLDHALKPVESLKEGFKQIEKGNYGISLAYPKKDEIGNLINKFNLTVNELRKLKEKEALMHRQEKMASLGQLAAGVAHEIKNPLNAIQLHLQQFTDKFIRDANHPGERYLNVIQREIQRLEKTVNNMLTVIRSEKLDVTITDIHRMIEDILILYAQEIESKRISVKKQFDHSFLLPADEQKLRAALTNIIVNALQSMEHGGELFISTNKKDRQITIRDTGCGIEKDDLERIFDLFYTTRSRGTGMGLPIAYKIIREHQGEITINSIPGEGTEVLISLGELHENTGD
ncbi:MAG: hypothetical protein Kow00108_12740 [Calditrichia bacterium]